MIVDQRDELLAVALNAYETAHSEVGRTGVSDRIKALVADGGHLVSWTHAACMDAALAAVLDHPEVCRHGYGPDICCDVAP